MFLKILKDFYKKSTKLRKFDNLVEAAYWAKTIRRFSGAAVYELQTLRGNRIASKFSLIGFTCYIIWNSLNFYCIYKTFYEDQSILRMLYKTKLKRYGDDFERISSLMYILFTIFFTPFKLSGNSIMVQKIVDIDMVIEKAGDIVDYSKTGRTALRFTLGQIVFYIFRFLCFSVVLTSDITLPLEKIFQVVYSDALAVVTTSTYCYYMIIVRNRFKWVNKTLREIKNRNCWEYKVFVRGKVPTNMIKVVELQERHICEKINTCSRVYGSLFDVCMTINRLFGFALLFIMIHYFNYIILYLFYFMEATASGLFHDLKRYCDFLVYTIWQIVIALGIILFIIFLSESTMFHAKATSSITHQIINEGFSSTITNEAMQLSIQLLHEAPVFTVCGLFNLDYAFLQQGARSVSTYLVILLQFVTDTTSSI